MDKSDFQWGMLARSLYIAMLWFTLAIALINYKFLLYYGLLLLFLGLGLKPLLIHSGLYQLYNSLLIKADDRAWKKANQQRRQQIARQERDKVYRSRRVKDPKLPDNW